VKVLLIAPFPPPTTGHSLAAKTLLEAARDRHDVSLVDLSKEGFRHGIDSARRVTQVVRILKQVWSKKRDADVIYLTIAESVAGNIKDLMIYLICFPRLSRMVVHLHGGSIKKLLFDRFRFLRRINRFFIRRLGSVVILGESHREIFAGLARPDRVRIVNNCAEDALFIRDDQIGEKFNSDGPLRLIFLSNLIDGKGHNELLAAYLMLSDTLQNQVAIDFAGAFESAAERDEFQARLHGLRHVRYHGVVEGSRKADLLSRAHILCLPTRLFEGQPLCILEAYASGCVVMTTDQGGIRDVFQDEANGITIESPTPSGIKHAIERAVAARGGLLHTALSNARAARERYTTSRYSASLISVIEQVAGFPVAS
jgi:glycosyltransferase involved in cell wall biosynthesis